MIKIKSLNYQDGIVTFAITEQDKEDYVFFLSTRSYEFEKEKINVVSLKFPNCYKSVDGILHFFLRGTTFNQDERQMRVTLKDYLLIKKFLSYYNSEIDIMKKISKGEVVKIDE